MQTRPTYLDKQLLSVAFSIVLFLTAFESQASEQKISAVQAAHVIKTSGAIPLAEILARATELSNFLRNLDTQFAPGHEIDKIQKELSEVDGRITVELRRIVRILQSHPPLELLQTQQQLWQGRQIELDRWMNRLTQRANRLQAALNQLDGLLKRWGQTLESAKDTKAPETVIQEINTIIPAIEMAQTALMKKRRAVISLQGRVADRAAQCGTALAGISQAQQSAVGGLTRRESQPLWSTDLWVRVSAEEFSRFHDIIVEPLTDIDWYIGDPSGGMATHLVFFIGLSVLSFAMRRQVRRWPVDERSAVIATVTDYPWAAAFIGSLLIATSPYSPAPPTIRNLFSLLALAAMIRLIKPVVDKRVIPGLYTLGFLLTIDTARHIFTGALFFDQAMVVLEALSGVAVLAWSLVYGNLHRAFSQETGSARLHTFRAGAILVLIFLCAGFLAGILGYMRMARLLVSGILIGGAHALTLFVSVKILCAVTAFGLRVRPLRLLRMVQHHRDLLEHRTHRVLIWFAFVGWSIRVLDYVGMLQPVLSLAKTVLAVKLERGSISLSLEDILAFILTVWAAHLLSVFIRFVLQEDVYARKKVSQGIAYATSRLIHYLILAVGFVLGMGVLGVDLTKVTVLLGAFGVGIGFGLQSVVNNFVSGLILLFERPVHQGDTIEVGNLQGQVGRIGIRASIVRTRQGAEIIVPNSQLISEQVTNWTFSDRRRRIDLPVGVNYAAEPQKVIEVIEAVAAAHTKVLNDPQPRGLFVGFGESSIDFELRAWTDEFIEWQKIRSELAAAVYDAVRAAGFSFPFPQREVRLLHDSIEKYMHQKDNE